MTSEGLGEMFEGDSADMCAEIFLPVSMGGRAEGLVCADPGARTPIGAIQMSSFHNPIFDTYFLTENTEYKNKYHNMNIINKINHIKDRSFLLKFILDKCYSMPTVQSNVVE